MTHPLPHRPVGPSGTATTPTTPPQPQSLYPTLSAVDRAGTHPHSVSFSGSATPFQSSLNRRRWTRTSTDPSPREATPWARSVTRDRARGVASRPPVACPSRVAMEVMG